ncbi:sugar transferase [Dietzia cinnamea]|nr:sugar transferase [Dietzia cinnamea]
MALIWLVVRLKLGSPAVFTQVRPGRFGDPFTMYKFRTMTNARGSDGKLLPDSARLTPLGKTLRSTSLDELPELINVIKGEMSIVGPRPLLMRYTPYFTEEERLRLAVRPGITGWAQINGRNSVSWTERLALDAWYVRTRSLRLDARILAKTVTKVFHRDGLVVDPESVMKNLDDERRGEGA